MSKYITKYECPQCYTVCETYMDADAHCYSEPYEIYECSVCGKFTNDDSEDCLC